MSCFIPGCKTGYKAEKRRNKNSGVSNPSTFKARTKDMLDNWSNVLSRPGRIFTEKDRVCSRHFLPDEIEVEYKTILPDGVVNCISRGKPTLKPTAIPSISLNSSGQLSLVEEPTNNQTFPFEITEDCSVQKVISEDAESGVDKCEHSCDVDMTIQGSTNTDHTAGFDPSYAIQSVLQDKPDDFNMECLLENHKLVLLPSPFWASNVLNEHLIFTCWTNDFASISKRVLIQPDLSLRIFIAEREITISSVQKIESLSHIARTLSMVADILPCKGAKNDGHAKDCSGYVNRKKQNQTGRQSLRCSACQKLQKSLNLKKNVIPPIEKEKQKNNKLKRMNENVKRRNSTLKQKVCRLRQKVKAMQAECSQSKVEAVEAAISQLPENQQLAVRACLSASKLKSSKGMRYTNEWIFQCLLLRIKSSKVYEHLRSHQILILPCMDTLNKYIRAIKGCYGFDTATFKVLQEKVREMNPREKHGAILLDEMKLSKSLSFDRHNLEIQGFTNLGRYTPEHQKNKRGDHALVLMFQPFHGKWVQALACFLSKGCAPGAILFYILMECIALTEKCGLNVDVVACDGATWNRNMWERFGVSEEIVSVEHIIDPGRRLWFVSDFPHLAKNLRNWITKKRPIEEVWTPDGVVKLKHWDTLLEIEDPKSFNLKANFKLTQDHIRPEYYQKMNVAMAFQFFGVGDTMELFENDHDTLRDSKGTQVFCNRIKKVISAMNSRTPLGSMKIENQAWNDIKETLAYLRAWEKKAKAKGYEFMSDSTCYGLKISLQAALEVCQYLIENCEFKYLMTARLNQDNLERFFGMMRSCCGSNDHPDSTLFIQMYRLLSTYSLVKPPKGSNITGGDTINVLLSIKDVTNMSERRAQWDAQIDTILDRGSDVDALFDAASVLEEHIISNAARQTTC